MPADASASAVELAGGEAGSVETGRATVAALAADFWKHLPAWMFLAYGCLLLNTKLTNLDPPLPELAYTAAFPISVAAIYFLVRAWRAPDVTRRFGLAALVVALGVGLPTANLLWHRPSPLPLETLRLLYEVSNFGWVALMFTHAFRARPADAALFFGVGLLYGMLLENGGILLGYFSEHNLRTVVPPFVAPVSTMVGWCVVLYMAFFVARGLRSWLPSLQRSSVASAGVVAAAAVLLDLEIDPIATAAGCWVWHTELPPVLGDVPLVNFIAWACALLPFAWVVFRYQERRGLSDDTAWSRRDLRFMLVATPAVLTLAALLFLASTAIVEGVDGPSWRVLYRKFEPLAALVAGL